LGFIGGVFVRIGIDLRQKGFDATDVAVGVGLLAILNVAVCVMLIAIPRRLTLAGAVRKDVCEQLRDCESITNPTSAYVPGQLPDTG
jgi:hypothetical protein